MSKSRRSSIVRVDEWAGVRQGEPLLALIKAGFTRNIHPCYVMRDAQVRGRHVFILRVL
jgi:hypothetical protein